MFSKWDEDQDGSLEGPELLRMLRANRGLGDPVGVCLYKEEEKSPLLFFYLLGSSWVARQSG